MKYNFMKYFANIVVKYPVLMLYPAGMAKHFLFAESHPQ